MTQAIPRYSPQFQVQINDDPLPIALRNSISSLTYQTGLEGADRVELTLINDNLRWLDHALLRLDNPLTLSIGYAPDPLERVFHGEIISQEATFPSGGGPTLTVVAQDLMHRMQKDSKSRSFHVPVPGATSYPIPDPLIALAVGSEHFLLSTFDPVGAVIGVLLGYIDVLAVALGAESQTLIRRQTAETDADFLQRIARMNGWEMVIDHSGPLAGHKVRFFSPLSHLDADMVLKYGQSLVDFTPRFSNVGKIDGVVVPVWISAIKTEFLISVSWDWDRHALNILIVPSLGFPGHGFEQPGGILEWIKEPINLLTAPRKILSTLLPRLNNRLTGQGSTVGDPRIRAGTVLQLEGLGEQFGGRWRVTNATHSFDSGGYLTRFEVRKEVWFGSIPLPEQGAVPVQTSGQTVGSIPLTPGTIPSIPVGPLS